MSTKVRTSYLYQVVTSLGCGVHGAPMRSLRKARAAAESLRARHADAEVKRIYESPDGWRRYWLFRRNRWLLWDHVIRTERAALKDGAR